MTYQQDVYLSKQWKRIPYGGLLPEYQFTTGRYTPFDPKGYKGLVNVATEALPSGTTYADYKVGDVVQIDAYRFRIVEYIPWQDAFSCAFDTPLGWLQFANVRLRHARVEFMYRLFATARIWGLIEIDRYEDSDFGVKVTRILWIKVDKRTTV